LNQRCDKMIEIEKKQQWKKKIKRKDYREKRDIRNHNNKIQKQNKKMIKYIKNRDEKCFL